jgi:hypothetical protein
MTYGLISCPDHIKRDARGVLQSMQCKVCGAVIADTCDRLVGYEITKSGERVKVITRNFTRLDNFTEIKIAFEDPKYSHITHGCNKCLSLDMSPALLAELHQADQEDSPDGYTDRERAQVPVKVVAISHNQGGLV